MQGQMGPTRGRLPWGWDRRSAEGSIEASVPGRTEMPWLFGKPFRCGLAGEGAAGGEAAAMSRNGSGPMCVLTGWPEEEAAGGSGEQTSRFQTYLPACHGPRRSGGSSCQHLQGGRDWPQAVPVSWVSTTLGPFNHVFLVLFFLFFARGTGKGTREQSGPSDSLPPQTSHRLLSVPPPSPSFLQASHNPWPATSRSLGGPGRGASGLLFGDQPLFHLPPLLK